MNLAWNKKIRFPLCSYIHQLFFGSLDNVILSPFDFWCLYQVRFLEKCWQQDTTQQLEEYFSDNWSFSQTEQHWSFYWKKQLERCWEQDCIQFLESCWLQDCS